MADDGVLPGTLVILSSKRSFLPQAATSSRHIATGSAIGQQMCTYPRS
jgi:hypothetical protein